MSERRTAAAAFPARERADLAAAIAAHEKARAEGDSRKLRRYTARCVRAAQVTVARAERAAGLFAGASAHLFSDVPAPD